MAYPIALAAPRSQDALVKSLIQLVEIALALDTRCKANQRAYAGVLSADYEANGAAAGTGASYAQLNADLATFLGSPAWTKMMSYVDVLRDIGR